MKKYFFGLMAVLAIAWAAPAGAAAVEFYGTKVLSESYAQRALTDSEGVDRSVTATARVEDYVGVMRSLRIDVRNDSSKKLSAPYNLTDYIAVLNDGRRVRLKRPEAAIFPAGDSIRPNATTVLRPTFGELEIEASDIAMIICSLNLGETKIVLTRRAAPVAPAAPAPPAPVEAPAQRAVREIKAPKPAAAPAPAKKGPKTNFSSGNVPVTAVLEQPKRAVPTVKAAPKKTEKPVKRPGGMAAKKPAKAPVKKRVRTPDTEVPAGGTKTNFSSGNTGADRYR